MLILSNRISWMSTNRFLDNFSSNRAYNRFEIAYLDFEHCITLYVLQQLQHRKLIRSTSNISHDKICQVLNVKFLCLYQVWDIVSSGLRPNHWTKDNKVLILLVLNIFVLSTNSHSFWMIFDRSNTYPSFLFSVLKLSVTNSRIAEAAVAASVCYVAVRLQF